MNIGYNNKYMCDDLCHMPYTIPYINLPSKTPNFTKFAYLYS